MGMQKIAPVTARGQRGFSKHHAAGAYRRGKPLLYTFCAPGKAPAGRIRPPRRPCGTAGLPEDTADLAGNCQSGRLALGRQDAGSHDLRCHPARDSEEGRRRPLPQDGQRQVRAGQVASSCFPSPGLLGRGFFFGSRHKEEARRTETPSLRAIGLEHSTLTAEPSGSTPMPRHDASWPRWPAPDLLLRWPRFSLQEPMSVTLRHIAPTPHRSNV
jgi:hypothetical protein